MRKSEVRGRDLLARGASAAAETASRLRRARVFHPVGLVFAADLEITGGSGSLGAPLLDSPGEHEALVRMSKAVPTPKELPDVLGLALRLPHGAGTHRPVDLLFATTGSRPLTRHLLRPAGDFSTVYTTLLPYEIRGRTRLLAARPARPGRHVAPTLPALARSVAGDPLVFDLAAAGPYDPWRTFGHLVIHTRLPDEWNDRLSFDVLAHRAEALRPVGRLQALRGPVYAASRRGRGAPEDPDPPR